ncbi:MAG: DUF4446 family protein [Clostridia bacterium]|nr:DUF4446 family protein [Clostridia bacterium]
MNSNLILIFPILLIMALLLILCFILCMVSLSKCNRLKRQLSDGEFEEKIEEAERKISRLAKEASQSGALPAADLSDPGAIRRIGIERFDAFPGVTGAFSFSAALLDDNYNGIILTTLYGHESSNTYIREIKEGDSDVKLLEEEIKALEKAKNN